MSNRTLPRPLLNSLKALLISALLNCSASLQAQLNYVFSSLSGSYQALSTGTDLNSIETDDAHSSFFSPVPIGFTFAYDGTNVTQVRVNSNGWMSLSLSDAPSSSEGRDNSVMASASGDTRPGIMPLWDNLNGTGGVARYATTGSAGSRVFTMEWRDWRWGNGATGPVISFQCKLYEGSNAIEFIYRREGTAVSSGSASIGLLGNSSGEFISLNATSATPSTSTSVATTNLNTKPLTGQVYRFTPCISPTASYGSIALNCSSNSYFVPVNVTALGTSTAVSIVATPGGTMHSGVGVGAYNVGPFPFGTSVSVNVVGNAGCSTALPAVNQADPDATCHAAGVYPVPDNGCASNNAMNVAFCLSTPGTQLGADVFVRSVDLITSTTYNADLEVSLISPNGTSVSLVADRFGTGDNLGNPGSCPGGLFTLQGDGIPLSNANQSNVSGSFMPEQPLSNFHDGSNPNGTWLLRTCDDAAEDNASVRYVRVNLCRPVIATIARSNDCANGQFSATVNVSSFGSGSNASISFSVNGATPSTLTGVGLGVTTLGPFPNSASVAVTVTNGLSGCGSVSGTVYSTCPIVLDCGATLTTNYCYQNNDTRTFTFTSPIPGETVSLNFVQGSLDLSDGISVYDGENDLAPALGGGNFFGNLAGASFVSTGPALHVTINSNGTNSCADGGQSTPWVMEARCTPGCQSPVAIVDVLNDCNTYSFSLDLMTLYAGDGLDNDVVYAVNGGSSTTVPGVTEGSIINLGPFTIGDQVNILLKHDTDALCDFNMGSFTNTISCPSAENCINALNLATQTSPLAGTTTGRTNEFTFACGTTTNNTANDAIYFIDVPAGQQLNIRQQSNNYDSQHYLRYGAPCPGANVIACIDDENGETGWLTWTNTTGAPQRVWWIQDGYQALTGNFVLEWNIATCPTPVASAATNVLANAANANFSFFNGDYIVEFGPSSTFTTPGTAATAGPNGTVLTTSAAPVQISGLAPATQYRYFVRRVCGSGVYSGNSNGITFTTTNGVTMPNTSCGQNLTIPDNGCGSNVLNALITISGQNDQLGTNVALESVDLIITHADRSDVDVVLISPTGQSRNLILDRGTTADNYGNNGSCPTGVFKLRDGGSALSGIPNTNNVTGTYAPEQTLAGFTGDPNGIWTLRICDDDLFSTGALRYVSLNFAVVDCQGTIGGTALPGTSCNDGNPCTINDTYSPTCACLGTFQDTDNDGTCNANDGCPNDPGKTAPGVCGCGTPDVTTTYFADADGDGSGDPFTPIAGYTCSVPPGHVLNGTDGCPSDPNKVSPGLCGCGTADTDSDNDGTPNCNDGCPADPLKVAPGACGCGVPDTDNDNDGTANCNDGCPNDPLKVAPGVCGCGNPDADSDGDGSLDCLDSCPTLFGQIGSPCDDNNAATVLDRITAACLCAGTPCTEQVNFALDLDLHGSQISWQVAQEGTNAVICSGGIDPQYPNNVAFPLVESCCLPVGCYTLSVFDSAGDGILGGGYQLRESGLNGRRIIDNSGNFTSGSVSSVAGGQDFCVPLGSDKLIFSSCDKMDWVANRYVVASANPVVSATWNTGAPDNMQPSNSGYEFWIFDPNGGFSIRRFRSHNVSDGFSPASATRACHMKLNAWLHTVTTPHVPTGVMMNVRVRGRVNGVNLPFGQACKLKVDPVRAACPLVKLQDDPSNASDYSCGVFKNFGGSNSQLNRLTAMPPQFSSAVPSSNVRYQFRFRIPGESVCIIRPPQTSPTLHLNWSSGPQLDCGKTYKVDVRVSKDLGATWCVDQAVPQCDPNPVTPWGKVCDVTINQCLLGGGNQNMTSEPDQAGEPILYPNPNSGQRVRVEWIRSAKEMEEVVTVAVFDLAGKKVHQQQLISNAGVLRSELDLPQDLVSGIYLVHLAGGQDKGIVRLVIEH